MIKNLKDYIENLKKIILRHIIIINTEKSLDLTEELIDELISFLNDILDLLKEKHKERYLEIFYKQLPIKRPEYLAAAFIYFILNYRKNPIKIKISEFAEALDLARQNIRRVLNYLASFNEILQKYKLTYTPRQVYSFDAAKYINQISSYVKIFHNQLIEDLKLLVKNPEKQTEEIMNLIKKSISSIQKSTDKKKLFIFYNSLDQRVRDPQYLAAVICYIYFRFLKYIYIRQEEFVNILNKIENIDLTFDSFSRTYSNFSEKYFIIEQQSYLSKIIEYLDVYIKRINNHSGFPLQLTVDFKNRTLELFDEATEKGFKIQSLAENKYGFAQSKKFLPEYIAACLIFLALKSYDELEDYATRDYMEKFLENDLDYSRVTSNQSPLYNYLKDYIGRYKFQPYSIENFTQIIKRYIRFYNKIKSPHHESVLLLKIFIYSELNPSDFAKRLNIHGGTTNDLLKIVKKKKNFKEISIIRKITEFIQLNVPQENKSKYIRFLENFNL